MDEKYEIVTKLAENENLHMDLINIVNGWISSKYDNNDLRKLLLDGYEHSFLAARNNYYIANTWINSSDGSDDNVVMYLFERFKLDNGKHNDIPVGMYIDIEKIFDRLKNSPFDNDGGKIEVWEKQKNFKGNYYFKHRMTFYSNREDVIGFEFMREVEPLEEDDPFEPVIYCGINNHYMCLE